MGYTLDGLAGHKIKMRCRSAYHRPQRQHGVKLACLSRFFACERYLKGAWHLINRYILFECSMADNGIHRARNQVFCDKVIKTRRYNGKFFAFTVIISCKILAAPYAYNAQTSISPKRCPPNCALPPSGCWVTSEYGPVLRA